MADDPDDGPRLAGEYVVTAATEGGETHAFVPGSQVRLTFEDGALKANAGCNHLFADFRLEGDRLEVGPVGGTEMGCSPELMAQDSWLSGVLTGSLTVTTEPLALTKGEVVLELTPRAEVSPDLPLVGTTWTLNGFIDGETASSLPMLPSGSTPPTLELKADGTAGWGTGCNGAGSRYEVNGGQVTWIEPVQTLMACEDARGEVERHVTAVLEGATTWSVKERTLTITKGDKGLTYVASQASSTVAEPDPGVEPSQRSG